MRAFVNPAVATVFEAYPEHARPRMLALRALIFDVAEGCDEVGGLTECLKWGEPAYVPPKKVGTTIRIDWKASAPEQCAIYVHCQTTLVNVYRGLFPASFDYEGNRSIRFPLDLAPDDAELRTVFALALTYHRRKRSDVWLQASR